VTNERGIVVRTASLPHSFAQNANEWATRQKCDFFGFFELSMPSATVKLQKRYRPRSHCPR